MNKKIPESLTNYILPFNWDVSKIWPLDATVQLKNRMEFDHLLEKPFWSSKPNAGMLFDISPMEVLNNLDKYPHQKIRVLNADLTHPLDFLELHGKYWILDGLHRLAKLHLDNSATIKIRLHSEDIIPLIRTPTS